MPLSQLTRFTSPLEAHHRDLPGRPLLGGNGIGTRLNKPYRENIDEAEIVATLDGLFARFAAERLPGERFGDFVPSAGIVRRVDNPARDFHD